VFSPRKALLGEVIGQRAESQPASPCTCSAPALRPGHSRGRDAAMPIRSRSGLVVGRSLARLWNPYNSPRFPRWRGRLAAGA